MASTNDNIDGENFKWTNEYVVLFCEIFIKYIRKHRCGLMKWKEIKEQFEAIAKRKIVHRSLKKEWDAMKKEWRTWKELKHEETGLGWDLNTHNISGSDGWWEKKFKENSVYKKFRNKSIDPAMNDLWSRIFQDCYANAVGPFGYGIAQGVRRSRSGLMCGLQGGQIGLRRSTAAAVLQRQQ
ncbi:uncharacterized protein LOC116032279 [Ipomoea triloba]|uniref:uncharacterized protein LOC116032279 n=1 Tax=Ipomoea triloba TaxID=35885 RepID=UPI00125DAC55|nr:uncharacterized protein LOC116032279 [Ipomoea triloba]